MVKPLLIYHMILQKYADLVLKKGFLLKRAVMLSNSIKKKILKSFFYSVKVFTVTVDQLNAALLK